MSLNLVCLVVHPDRSITQSLEKALHTEIQFTSIDYAASISAAFQQLIQTNYNICFIHSSHTKDLDAFFGDMSKAGRDKTCAFVQLWQTVPEDLDKTKMLSQGFSAVISENTTPQEKTALKEVLKAELHRQEVTERVHDVKEAIGFLVKSVDRLAQDKQRGKDSDFDRLILDFITENTSFDEEVLHEYFEELGREAEASPSFKTKQLQIPEFLQRFPGISKDRYKGTSLRVWERMLNKFGVPIDEPVEESAKETSGLRERTRGRRK